MLKKNLLQAWIDKTPGMTQEKLGQLTGIGQSLMSKYCRWLAGTTVTRARRPGIKNAVKIQEATGGEVPVSSWLALASVEPRVAGERRYEVLAAPCLSAQERLVARVTAAQLRSVAASDRSVDGLDAAVTAAARVALEALLGDGEGVLVIDLSRHLRATA